MNSGIAVTSTERASSGGMSRRLRSRIEEKPNQKPVDARDDAGLSRGVETRNDPAEEYHRCQECG